MGRFVLIDVVVAGVLLLLWYGWFVSYNRRRGAALLHWVQAACLGRGRVLDPRWKAGSTQLKATLRLSSRWFEDARLTVRLQPRPFPVQWFLSRWRKQGADWRVVHAERLWVKGDKRPGLLSRLAASVLGPIARRRRR